MYNTIPTNVCTCTILDLANVCTCTILDQTNVCTCTSRNTQIPTIQYVIVYMQ